MNLFSHEKLDVYRLSIEFITVIERIVKQIPKGRAYLVDQLQRAGTSVPLNVAEGAGEFSPKEKSRFYRMAKRSATECAAIMDVCFCLKLVSKEMYGEARELLFRIVSMLTKLAKKNSFSDKDTDADTDAFG